MSQDKLEGAVVLKKYAYPIVNGVTTESLTDSRQAWAEIASVRRSEFYTAAQAGTAVELCFTVWAWEYDGQQVAEYDSHDYDVKRTYRVGTDRIELTVARRGGR